MFLFSFADLADLRWGTRHYCRLEKLETQLPLIFRRAEKWDAVLLLDETYVYLDLREDGRAFQLP
jgi:hypothetical protein